MGEFKTMLLLSDIIKYHMQFLLSNFLHEIASNCVQFVVDVVMVGQSSFYVHILFSSFSDI